ncbi:hypothetical protein LMBIIBHN_02388 [Aeromonas salmonicida]
MNVPLRCMNRTIAVSKRVRTMKVAYRQPSKGYITDMVIDSTGLQVFGEGEWKHGTEKRQVWRKLYLAMPAHSLLIRPSARSLTCRKPIERVTAAIVQRHAPTEKLFQGSQIIGLSFETGVALAQQDVAVLLRQGWCHLIGFDPFGPGDEGVDPKLELAHRLVLDPLTGFSLDESRQCVGERDPTAGAS